MRSHEHENKDAKAYTAGANGCGMPGSGSRRKQREIERLSNTRWQRLANAKRSMRKGKGAEGKRAYARTRTRRMDGWVNFSSERLAAMTKSIGHQSLYVHATRHACEGEHAIQAMISRLVEQMSEPAKQASYVAGYRDHDEGATRQDSRILFFSATAAQILPRWAIR